MSVTTTVNVGPTHDPLVGVTVYVAVCCVLVGFVSVPLIFVWPDLLAPPVNPPVTVGALQE